MTDDTDQAAVYMSPKELVPWGRNPRKNEEAAKKVADSIRRFGFGSPIVARKSDNQVIAGHTRLLAAKMLGLKRVPVRLLDVSDRDSELLALADNKLGEIAEWDNAELGKILSDYGFQDVGLAGWDFKELGSLAEALDPGGATDDAKTVQLNTDFSVVVTCADENEQIRVLEWCQQEGLKCRALI